MNFLKTSVLCFLISASSNSAAFSWTPEGGLPQIPIWTGTPPHAKQIKGPELDQIVTDKLVAGKPWRYTGNVCTPTVTVYPAKGAGVKPAVLVFPGGGYQILAMDLEGTEICQWLNSKGITGVLLKYRVPGENRFPKSGSYPKSSIALEDAQRAMRVVRSHAKEWNIDASKIGVLGFSAGGHLSAAMSTHFDDRIYPVRDAVDKVSCRPDFSVVIYPGHLVMDNGTLNPDIKVTKRTPTTFILQAENDPVDDVANSLVYFSALKKAGVPAEMHFYAEGGHAFGMRHNTAPITHFDELLETWLKTVGVISK